MTTQDDDSLPIVVNIVNFQYTGGFRFETTKIQRYVGAYPREYELHPGDVLLVMTCQTPAGEILGVPGQIPRGEKRYLHNQRMGLATLQDREALDLGFLYYLFLSPQFNHHLFKTATGAKILHTAPSRIEDYRFARPPVETQTRIASILSTYDHLIENNTRRIKILQEMAQMIYREWFVNFRFPGHERVKMVQSELGPIPEGWTERKLGDVLTLEYGKALKESDRLGGSVVVYGSSGVVGRHSHKLTSGPGIIVGRKGNVGSVFFCHSDFWVIDTAYYVRSTLPLYFLYFNLLTQNFLNNDAAVPGLNRNQAHSLPVTVPDSPMLAKFERMVTPMFELKRNLAVRNTNLRRTRDFLLPKLISGEIPVDAAAPLTEQTA